MAPQTPTGAQDVWYVDLNHTDAVATPAQNPFGNYRKHGSPLAGGDGQDALAFSYRAADDARTVYSGADGVFRKWDISTDPPTEITTGNWPFDTGETRLHIVTSQDGPWITGTVYQYQDVWFWNQDTNASCEITKVAEPDAGGGFIDRGAAYGFIEVDDTVAGDVEVRRWVANCTFNGRSTRHQSHSDICKGFALMTDPQTGNKLWRLEMATNTETDVGSDGEVVDSPGYFAQQWIEGVSGISQLWALFSADATPNDGKIQYGIIMIPFDYPTRACRFFAHTDTRNTSDFYARSHATMSPDGKVVMWNSDMNNQGGRVDVFCALMPTS
jgi:hypothetical protein